MIQQSQDARAVTRAQPKALVPRDDLLGGRQRDPHDEHRQAEALVGRRFMALGALVHRLDPDRRENPLLFAGGTQLDTVVLGRRRCRQD